jgi:hypothetical protein
MDRTIPIEADERVSNISRGLLSIDWIGQGDGALVVACFVLFRELDGRRNKLAEIVRQD